MQHQEHTWSGRAVARIFHGIQSPNFPAKQWGRVRGSWRRHLDVDFNLLVRSLGLGLPPVLTLLPQAGHPGGSKPQEGSLAVARGLLLIPGLISVVV